MASAQQLNSHLSNWCACEPTSGTLTQDMHTVDAIDIRYTQTNCPLQDKTSLLEFRHSVKDVKITKDLIYCDLVRTDCNTPSASRAQVEAQTANGCMHLHAHLHLRDVTLVPMYKAWLQQLNSMLSETVSRSLYSAVP